MSMPAAYGIGRRGTGARRDRGVIEMAGRRREQHADDFILQEAQPFGAMPSVPVAQELGLRRVAGLDEFGL